MNNDDVSGRAKSVADSFDCHSPSAIDCGTSVPRSKRKQSFHTTFKAKKAAMISKQSKISKDRSSKNLLDCTEKVVRHEEMQCETPADSSNSFDDAPSSSPRAYNVISNDMSEFRFDSPASQVDEDDVDIESSDSNISETSTSITTWIDHFKAMSPSTQCEALSSLVDECSLLHIKHLNSVIEPFFQRDFISYLPSEVALYILSFMSAADLVCISSVCRYWHHLIEDNQLWRRKCEDLGLDITDLPSDRSCGAWIATAQTSDIEILGYRPVKERYSSPSTKGFTSHLNSYGNKLNRGTIECLSPNPKRLVFHRSKWKSVYLRYLRVQANWRSLPLTGSCIMKGHDEHVITCLRIRGDLIVTGSDDNFLKVWSVSRAKCLHTLIGHTGGVWSSQMSKCGKIIASGSTDRTIRIWCTKTGRCLHNLQGHISTVRCLSLKGDMLVSGSRDSTIRLWNIKSGDCVSIYRGHVAAVRCVQFDGARIVSGAYDFLIKVWHISTGHCVHTLSGHTNRVYSLLFDSERDVVVSGSLDTTIRVWNVRLGICLHTLVGHQSLTSGMQLRGNILVSGNADSTIKIWDITDGQCKYTLSGPHRHASAVTSLQFLENGLVATSSDDGSVKLWDVERGVFVRDLVCLRSGGSGGCIWRLKSTPTMLVCAVGSRNGTEDTKLIMLNFDSDFP